MSDEIFDLLGDPIPENFGKRGRPPHICTEQNRRLVMQLLAFGWNDERIANALGITKPTLKKHYFFELRAREAARDRLEACRIAQLWEEARKGNVAAMKEYGRLIERADSIAAMKNFDRADETPTRKLGKKEQAEMEAATAGEGSEWGDDLIPTAPTQH